MKFELDLESPNKGRIWIDGQEINCVKCVHIDIGVKRLPIVKLELVPSQIRIKMHGPDIFVVEDGEERLKIITKMRKGEDD